MTSASALSSSDWLVTESGTDAHLAGARETRFTVGNGYLATRGSLVEGRRGSWPATYIAGVFDQRDASVVDLVNAPDWLATKIHVGGQRLDLDSCKVLSHSQTLDLRSAILHRTTDFECSDGRRTRLSTMRFASMDDRHLVAARLEITPLNHNAQVAVETGINGHTFNLDRTPYTDLDRFDDTERWEKWAKTKHTRHQHVEADAGSARLEMATFDRDIRIGYAMELDCPEGTVSTLGLSGHEHAVAIISIDAEEGKTYVIDKLVGVATSRDYGVGDGLPLERAGEAAKTACSAGLDEVLKRHTQQWESIWHDCDCVVGGDDDATRALRFNVYHLLIAANPDDPTVSIGAKSLSGEGYKGHVFWDTEIFVLPFFTYTQPDTARALLRYRYETLDGARENARQNGFEGAQYAWESADTGAETTPKWTHDGLHRIWTGEEEVHITADVVYALVTYTQATGDADFMRSVGTTIAFEAARFWASRLEWNPDLDSFELTRVIGPDEFHEHVDNNHYTNVFAQWTLRQAADLAELWEPESSGSAIAVSAGGEQPTEAEIASWRSIADRVHIPAPRDDGIIEQFEGYGELHDVPIVEWDHNEMPVYPDGYDHFNCGPTTLIKQPDVLMLMYLLPDLFDPEAVRANYDFYEGRTMHKSSLSPAIHAVMGIEARAPKKALQYFRRSAFVDLADNQGNSRDGIHIASAGGTWLSAVAGFGGFRVREGKASFDPWLPDEWSSLTFALSWQGSRLRVRVSHDDITFESPSGQEPPTVQVSGRDYRLLAGEPTTISYQTGS